MIDFKRCRDQIPIVKAAERIGYVLRPEKGKRSSVCMGLPDGRGGFRENIIVTDGGSTYQNHYFNPGNSFDKGDLISFIQNHIEEFESQCCVFTGRGNSQAGGRYDIERVSNVLSALTGMPLDTPVKTADGGKAKIEKAVTFSLNNYLIEELRPVNRYFLTETRKLGGETVDRFAPFIRSVAQVRNPRFFNTAFPYHEPGKKDICNFEIRNVDYKRHALGGNKVSACWIATFAQKAWQVEIVLLFESAIDALSYYELYRPQLEHRLDTLAFISVGGRVTKQQIQALKAYFRMARFVCCFDNDYAGVCYDIATSMALTDTPYSLKEEGDAVTFTCKEHTFTVPKADLNYKLFTTKAGVAYNIVVQKPQLIDRRRLVNGAETSVWFKDWNDILQQRKSPKKAYNYPAGKTSSDARLKGENV